MIKRYNQFVKENKTNEEFEMEAPATSTRTLPSLGIRGTETKPETPITTPDTPTRPRPTRPGIAPTQVPSEQDAPLASYGIEEDEEVGMDKYSSALKSLGDIAMENGHKVDFETEGDEKIASVTIDDKKINFWAEDDKYHVEGVKKPFATVEEVLAYFQADNSSDSPQRQEVRGEMSSIKDQEAMEEPSFEETEGELAKRDLEEEMKNFESKSYKSKRVRKR
jgi:translation elongation factor P/translation initiation factor 5A